MILMELSLVDLTVTRRARCDDSQCFLEVTYTFNDRWKKTFKKRENRQDVYARFIHLNDIFMPTKSDLKISNNVYALCKCALYMYNRALDTQQM